MLCYVVIVSESTETDSASIKSEAPETKICNIKWIIFLSNVKFYVNAMRPLKVLYNPYLKILLIDTCDRLINLLQQKKNLYNKPAKGILCLNNMVENVVKILIIHIAL